jgi:hypothetical protein
VLQVGCKGEIGEVIQVPCTHIGFYRLVGDVASSLHLRWLEALDVRKNTTLFSGGKVVLLIFLGICCVFLDD